MNAAWSPIRAITSKPSTPDQNPSARSRSETFRWTCPMSTRGSIAIAAILDHARVTPDQLLSRRSAVAVLERGLLSLRAGEGQRPRADAVVEVVLDPVDGRRARVGLGPQVARVGRTAAQLEADQVVLLERRGRAAQVVLREALRLEAVGVRDGRAHRARPPAAA